MSIADARAALAAALDSIDDLRCPDGYMRDQINPPEAMVDYEVTYHLTFGPDAPSEYLFTVKLFLGRTAERSAQKLLDQLKDGSDTQSVKYVVENYTTTAWDYARVRSAGLIQVATVGTTDYLMVEFPIEVVL